MHNSPSEVASPLSEVDGDRNVADERNKHDDSDRGLQGCGQVHAGGRNVKDLGPYVEDDSGQDALNGAGASIHDAGHLPRLSVKMEVKVQIKGVHKDIETDAPAHDSKLEKVNFPFAIMLLWR